MTNNITEYTALTEVDKIKYAEWGTEQFELPENIWTLKKTSKINNPIQETENKIESILEISLFPEINLSKQDFKDSVGLSFHSFLTDNMKLYYGEDALNKWLDSVEEKIFTPIRETFTKENTENLLNKIGIMEENKTLSSKEKEIKEFFGNIDYFFEEFENKIKKLRDYKYTNALKSHKEEFINEVKEFVNFINKATEDYKHFTDIFNKETEEKNKKNKNVLETTEDKKTNEEVKTSMELFNEWVKSLLGKLKK